MRPAGRKTLHGHRRSVYAVGAKAILTPDEASMHGMNGPRSDALVFFGATGDLAYKKIFPALQAMIRHGDLNVPIIGVAKAGWDLEKLKERAKDSLDHHG